jgi:nucleolar protein 56
MRAYLGTNFIGSFAFDGKGKVLEKSLFKKNPKQIAEKLAKSRSGELLAEEKEVLDKLVKMGIQEIIWNKKVPVKGLSCVCKEDNLAEKILKEDFRRLATEFKWSMTQAELNQTLSKVNIELSKTQIQKPKKDKILIHAVGVLDEVDGNLNVFVERLREWYGLHFPEMGKMISNHEKFVEIVMKFGEKENIELKELEKAIEQSAGMPFDRKDMEIVRGYARNIYGMYKVRKDMEGYVKKVSQALMPNMSAIAEPILAARLLALAGSLEKISKMPSSTIQLLGAEKALFRHLKGQGKSPKYGIIFSHSLIQKAPLDRKGKIARLIASKLTLAARVDFFSKEDRGKKMRKDLEEEVRRVLG